MKVELATKKSPIEHDATPGLAVLLPGKRRIAGRRHFGRIRRRFLPCWLPGNFGQSLCPFKVSSAFCASASLGLSWSACR
jgi:hypothetical protein